MNFLNAYVTQTEPTYNEIGIAYMLVDDAPTSSSDPFATEPTGPEDWVRNGWTRPGAAVGYHDER